MLPWWRALAAVGVVLVSCFYMHGQSQAQSGDILIRRLGPGDGELIRRLGPRENLNAGRKQQRKTARAATAAPVQSGLQVPGFQIFENSDISGGDITSFQNATADQCAAVCAQNTQCTAFTHNIGKSVCFLKSTGKAPKRFDGAVSGRKIAGQPVAPPAGQLAAASGFEIFQNADMPGNDFVSYRNATADQCQAACGQNSQCQAFTHNIGKGVCFLKSASGSTKAFQGAVSGRKATQAGTVIAKIETPIPPSFPGSTRTARSFNMFDKSRISGAVIQSGLGFNEDLCISMCAANLSCVAFTLDPTVGGGTCELLSNASPPQSVAEGVAGVRASAVELSSARGEAGNGFLRYRDTDLMAFHGFDERGGEGASVENCENACLMSDACRGYAHDASEHLCRLISVQSNSMDIPRAKVLGTTSGTKTTPGEVQAARQSYLASIPQVPEADNSWRADDTVETFATRLRESARQMGGSCDTERARLEQLSRSLQITLARNSATIGEKIKLDFKVGELNALPPSWLMVSVDTPVRFDAAGFYALTPGAIAPFAIGVDMNRTRALTTLFARDDLASGSIELVPIVAGSMKVSVRIVGFVRACGEEFAGAEIAEAVVVEPSATPVFQVRDPFSFDRPLKRWLSPTGTTRLEAFEDRFRLVDVETGAFIADMEGTEPSYSPTGRYVTFRQGERSQPVLDTLDGKIVRTLNGVVAWENNDSFAVEGTDGGGGIFSHGLLMQDLTVGASVGCRICSGRQESYVLDLENDVMHGATHAQRLSGLRSKSIIQSAVDPSAKYFIGQQSGVSPSYDPVRWSLRGGLKFAPFEMHIEGKPETWEILSREEFENTFRVPELAPGQMVNSDEELQPVALADARGAVALGAPKVGKSSPVERLGDLGLTISADREPSLVHQGRKEKEFGMGVLDPALAKRILKSVPNAKGAFALTRDTHHCNPDEQVAANGFESTFAIFDNAVEYKIGKRSIWLTFYACGEGSAAMPYPNLHFFDSDYSQGFLRIDEDAPKNARGNIGQAPFKSRLYADRYLLIWSTESPGMLLFDVNERKTIWKEFNLGRVDLFEDARYSVEDGHVTQINSDGSFFVYDTRAGTRVMEGRYVDDETIAWTPDLRFDASPEGANYVNLRFPGQQGQYAFQQFARAVKYPGLVRNVMARTYTASDQKLAIPPQLTGKIEADSGRIRGDLQVARASELRVYQDGLLSDTIPIATSTAKFDVGRVAGTRWVSLVAYNSGGIASLPVGRDLGRQDALPVLHALTIGIDRYSGDRLKPLHFAKLDAETLLGAIRSQDGVSLKLGSNAALVDEAATPDAILAAAEKVVADAKRGETIVFSYAGHGVTGPDGRFYIATSTTDADNVEKTALSWTKLAAIFAKAQARIVVFLDACHSGAAGTEMFASNDNAVDAVLEGIPAGLLIFSASRGRESSEESAAVGGGYFTNAIADVIARDRKSYDTDGNGAIEASELYFGIKRKVSLQTDGRQTPWFARNEMIGDFSLF